MGIGSGLSGQLATALENSYGANTTPTLFTEYLEQNLAIEPGTLESRGSGQITLRSGRSRRYAKSAGGTIRLPVMQRGMGKILKQMFGAASGPTQVGSTDEYRQTHTPALSTGRAGVSAVWQAGVPQVDGTVKPFTYHGCKVTAWELVQALDANLALSLTLDAKPVSDTATALAVASYPAGLVPLAFIDATVEIGGVAADLKELTISHQAALNIDRRFLGNTKKEPIANGEWVFGGSFGKEFEDTDLYEAFLSGEEGSLHALWSYGDITGDDAPFFLDITIPCLRYDGQTPNSSGSDIVMQQIPFKALNNGTDAIITALYATDDTAL